MDLGRCSAGSGNWTVFKKRHKAHTIRHEQLCRNFLKYYFRVTNSAKQRMRELHNLQFQCSRMRGAKHGACENQCKITKKYWNFQIFLRKNQNFLQKLHFWIAFNHQSSHDYAFCAPIAQGESRGTWLVTSSGEVIHLHRREELEASLSWQSDLNHCVLPTQQFFFETI